MKVCGQLQYVNKWNFSPFESLAIVLEKDVFRKQHGFQNSYFKVEDSNPLNE